MGDDESSASYIHMSDEEEDDRFDIVQVHHMIEKCLIFKMSKEECMEALSKHAKIKPVITSTVWNELEKENKEFFEAYAANSQAKDSHDEDRMSEEETSKMIHKLIQDSTKQPGT